MDEYVGAFLVFIAVFIGAFLLLREWWCWYWKINQRIALQKEMISLLRANLEVSAVENPRQKRRVVRQLESQLEDSGEYVDDGVDDPDALEAATRAVMEADA